MKIFLLGVLIFFLGLLPARKLLSSQEISPQALYLQAYETLENIKQSEEGGAPLDELNTRRAQVQQTLLQLRQQFPQWQPEAVEILLKQCRQEEAPQPSMIASESVAEELLPAKSAELVIPPAEMPTTTLVATPSKAPPAEPSSFSLDQHLQVKKENLRLRSRVYYLENEMAKLKETLQKTQEETSLKSETPSEAGATQLKPISKEQSSQLLESGKRLFKENHLEEALSQFRSALEEDSQNPSALFYVAVSLIRMNQHAEALKELDIVINLYPSTAELYYFKGVALEKMGQPIEAVEEYKNALFLKGDLYPACVKLGLLLFREKKYEDALGYFKKAAALQPKSCRDLYNAGACHAKLKEFANAEKMMQQALELKPDYSLALTQLGNLYIRTGQKDKAIEVYQKAIQGQTQDSQIYNNLGNLYLEQGKIKAAILAFEKAIALDPKNAMACNNLGLLYARQGKYNEAIEWEKKAVAMAPDLMIAHFNLASAYYRKKAYGEAQTHLQKTLSLVQKESALYKKAMELLSEVERKAKKTAKAN